MKGFSLTSVKARNVWGDAYCNLYGSSCESTLYDLRDCPIVRKVREKIASGHISYAFYRSDLQ